MAKKNSSKTPKKTENDEMSDADKQLNEMNKRATRIVGVGMAALVAVGLFFFVRTEGGYTEELRADYVSSCVEQSGQQQLCECTYDRLSAQIDFAEFEALDDRANRGETTAEDNELVTGIAFACVAEARGN